MGGEGREGEAEGKELIVIGLVVVTVALVSVDAAEAIGWVSAKAGHIDEDTATSRCHCTETALRGMR